MKRLLFMDTRWTLRIMGELISFSSSYPVIPTSASFTDTLREPFLLSSVSNQGWKTCQLWQITTNLFHQREYWKHIEKYTDYNDIAQWLFTKGRTGINSTEINKESISSTAEASFCSPRRSSSPLIGHYCLTQLMLD